MKIKKCCNKCDSYWYETDYGGHGECHRLDQTFGECCGWCDQFKACYSKVLDDPKNKILLAFVKKNLENEVWELEDQINKQTQLIEKVKEEKNWLLERVVDLEEEYWGRRNK